MDELQLDDLLAFYPSSTIPDIQTRITAKKEFNELASDPFETLKKIRGDYFKHQRLIERILQHYDELILFHETGTGKSCAITAAAELLRRQRLRGEEGYIRNAIIIVNNKQLKARMTDEVICKCTDGIYDTPEVGDSKRLVHRNLKEWYTIKTRESFARKLSTMSNRDLIATYSNTIIFVDEAHNLRFRAFKGEQEQERDETPGQKIKREKLERFLVQGLKALAKDNDIEVSGNKTDMVRQLVDTEALTIRLIQRAVDSKKYKVREKGKKKKPEFGKEDIYIQFWRLFHVAKNIKKVLATATPMVNDSSEIKDLLNLLLPSRIPSDSIDFPTFKRTQKGVAIYKGLKITDLDALLTIPLDIDIEDLTEEELEVYLRGKISYVRRLDTGVDIEYMGESISDIEGYKHRVEEYETETKVYLTEMEKKQAEIYKKVRREKQNELRDKERQVSNFVYPDGSYGIKGFNKYIKQERNRFRVKTTKNGKIFREKISTLEGIRELGTKFADTIEIANVLRGNVFIYSNYSKASGAVPLSLCFEAQGYEFFDESRATVFRPRAVTTVRTYCASGEEERVIRKSFKKKLRYAFLTPDIKSADLELLLELMNAPENRYGDYIKVFITTPVGGEGISLNNVVSIHLIDGDWKHATNYQAESRAIRATSHVLLLQEKRLEYVEKGLDPEDARIDIKVYNHAAYTESDQDELLSVDIRLYERSEEKDRQIKRIERLMKRVAVDCQIHFLRNTRVKRMEDGTVIVPPGIQEKDGTGECDYEPCVYECWSPSPTTTDYTTYDVYYIDEPIEAVTRILQEYFKVYFKITMDGVVELIRNNAYPYLYIDIPAESKYVQYAVNEILSAKVLFFNRYGQHSYLQKDDDVLFLQMEYPTLASAEEPVNISNYTSNLIGIQNIPLVDFTNVEKEREELRRITGLEKVAIFSPAFERIFYSLGIKTLAVLLEEAIVKSIEGTEDDFSRKILRRLSGSTDPTGPILPFASLWYQIPEPTKMIQLEQRKLEQKALGRGRKKREGPRIPDTLFYDPQEEYRWDEGSTRTEPVYFHILYSLKPGRTDYDAVSEYNNVAGRIRLFLPSEGAWRDASPVEQVVYSLWGQRQIYTFKQPYEEADVYGFYVSGPTKIFRLRVKFTEEEESTDRRKSNRGRVCKSLSVPVLIRVMDHLNIPVPETVDLKSIQDMDKRHLVTTIRAKRGFATFETEELTKDQLEYYLGWIHAGYRREQMCVLIEEPLVEQNLVFQTY